jgi:hypothetical protein
MLSLHDLMMALACGELVRFPLRRVRAVLIVPASHERGSWHVLVGDHGWVFASLVDARHEARWLSENFGLPVREIVQ